MGEWTWMLIVRFPEAARLAGHGLMGAAIFLGIVGWRVHKIIGLLERKLGRVNVPGPESLAAMYPSLPTWWIPESALGFLFVALLFLFGAVLAWAAKTALRLTR